MQTSLRSDHLPLKWFLLKDTLNAKVNNWAVELETYRIKFEDIKGKSNVLADTLSRLISIDPDVKLEPELAGYEFGQYCFEEATQSMIANNIVEVHDSDITDPVTTYTIPLPYSKIWEMQVSDKNASSTSPPY